MAINAECNMCGRRYQAPPEMAGKQVRCKQCGNVFLVPVVDPDADLDLDALAGVEQSFQPIPPPRPADAEASEDSESEFELAPL